MVYVQHVFRAHPEQVFLRYFWLFLWLHSGLEICNGNKAYFTKNLQI